MNRIQPIFEITEDMDKILSGDMTNNDRQRVIEEINTLLIKRDSYMELISEPYSDEELALGKKLLPTNQKIQQKMNLLFAELKTEMKQMKKQKNSNRKYTNPYENVQTIDGMFMDKRK
ncbi:flagellar protein FliT [Paucisalibacillus sp. EB02]|uniref:flagellar protein FliT n=1 Tax=Paucisalibacillus sp. EB02 TaxID=1347087 RepID=UPI0004B3486C|nr:flagellar protein FliT [Paucisalibacillus sp. EB02]